MAHSVAVISQKVLLHAISLVADRVNYGIAALPSNNAAIWRWEAKNLEFFGESVRHKIEDRRAIRTKVQADLAIMFSQMTEDTREQFLSTKKRKNETSASTVKVCS